jgi:hypothetical protein
VRTNPTVGDNFADPGGWDLIVTILVIVAIVGLCVFLSGGCL